MFRHSVAGSLFKPFKRKNDVEAVADVVQEVKFVEMPRETGSGSTKENFGIIDSSDCLKKILKQDISEAQIHLIVHHSAALAFVTDIDVLCLLLSKCSALELKEHVLFNIGMSNMTPSDVRRLNQVLPPELIGKVATHIADVRESSFSLIAKMHAFGGRVNGRSLSCDAEMIKPQEMCSSDEGSEEAYSLPVTPSNINAAF